MIYDNITEVVNQYLGDDFVLKYDNNHDLDWTMIVPNIQEKISYGVLSVDSGSTQQVSSQPIRVEQLRLVVAIPEDRAIFNAAINKLKAMLKDLNNTIVSDTESSAKCMLLFGEYQDSASYTVNGVRWWVSNVVFSATFYESFALAQDIEISVQTGTDLQSQPVFTTLTGILSANYLCEKAIDQSVANNNMIPYNFVNSIKRNLIVNLVCLKTDTLIQSFMTNEANITTYTIKYNNQIVTRTMNCILANLNENNVIGDVIKVQLTFLQTS